MAAPDISAARWGREPTSPLGRCLPAFLVERRKKAGLTQAKVAAKLGRYQSFVATVESGQRRVNVVEFLEFAEAIGFDPRDAIARLSSTKRR
jgi:transcriptional regulator with XRE-family HTH domain